MTGKTCILALIALLSVSCRMSDNDGSIRQKGVYLNIQSTIKTDETKAAISGTQLPNGATFGLFICDHHASSEPNPYREHSPQYNNIQAQRSNLKWMYSYAGYKSFPTIFVLEKLNENDDPIKADIFAYAPFLQDITNPEAIPFDINQQKDLMYAVENNDHAANKNIDPAASGTQIDIPLTFAHAFALLEFKILLKNEQYNHPDGNGDAVRSQLTNIKVRKNSSKNADEIHLYSTGIMNAIDGSLSSLQEASYLDFSKGSIGIDNKDSSGGRKMIAARMLLVPAEPDDDEYIFSFTFDKATFNTEFFLKKEHLRHGTTDLFGLKAGYKYTFNFELDNYLRFKDVSFGEWTTVEEPIYEIEI